MFDAFVNINDIPTHVITWGKWIEESINENEELVICITGNPGQTGFYTKFLSSLHDSLDRDNPVWIIGHAGHVEPPRSSLHSLPPLSGNEDKYGLDGQIKHKVEFIKKYVPENVKIRLIGHSVGAYIVLKILDIPEIKKRVKKAYLLFPTLEHIRDTPNGTIFAVAQKLSFIISLALILFNMLPVVIRTFLISIYFWVFGLSNHFIGDALKYTKRTVIEKVMMLAQDEMDHIKELDVVALKNHKELLRIYYSTIDGWVPVKHYTEIIAKVPNIDAILCEQRTPHSFVLKRSSQVAQMVAEWINTDP